MANFIEFNLKNGEATRFHEIRDAGYAEFQSVIGRHGDRAQVIFLKTDALQTLIRLRFPDGFEREFITYAGGDIQFFLQTPKREGIILSAKLIDQGNYAGIILVLDPSGLRAPADASASGDLINKMLQHYPTRWRWFKHDASKNCNCGDLWSPTELNNWEQHSEAIKQVFRLASKDIYLFSQITTPPLCPSHAYEIMKLIPQYNGYKSDEIIRFLEKYEDRFMALIFGFEGSPELVISFPFWESQRYGQKGNMQNKRIPQARVDAWTQEIMEAIELESFVPDEMGYNPNWRDLRFWWD